MSALTHNYVLIGGHTNDLDLNYRHCLQRLERPECCPEEYYSTMLQCWSHDPNERPKFKDLGLKLREIRPEQVNSNNKPLPTV